MSLLLLFLEVPELQKQSYNFIACDSSDYENVTSNIYKMIIFISILKNLDFCKVADIVVPLFSSKSCNIDQLAIDPFAHANAFDEDSYKFL